MEAFDSGQDSAESESDLRAAGDYDDMGFVVDDAGDDE